MPFFCKMSAVCAACNKRVDDPIVIRCKLSCSAAVHEQCLVKHCQNAIFKCHTQTAKRDAAKSTLKKNVRTFLREYAEVIPCVYGGCASGSIHPPEWDPKVAAHNKHRPKAKAAVSRPPGHNGSSHVVADGLFMAPTHQASILRWFPGRRPAKLVLCGHVLDDGECRVINCEYAHSVMDLHDNEMQYLAKYAQTFNGTLDVHALLRASSDITRPTIKKEYTYMVTDALAHSGVLSRVTGAAPCSPAACNEITNEERVLAAVEAEAHAERAARDALSATLSAVNEDWLQQQQQQPIDGGWTDYQRGFCDGYTKALAEIAAAAAATTTPVAPADDIEQLLTLMGI